MKNLFILFCVLTTLGEVSNSQDLKIAPTTTNGTHTITWTGSWILQSSSDLITWSNIPSATSPYQTTTPNEIKRFYRLSPLADLVITNAIIRTMDPAMPTATNIAIKDGVIIGLGNSPLTKFVGAGTVSEDAQGRLILPGFQDVHMHAIEAGLNENIALFTNIGSKATYESELQNALTAQTGGVNDWIIGAGVNMASLITTMANEGTTPLALIDSIISSRPAVISDDLGHGVWANTKALESLGYKNLTTHPVGGMLGLTSGSQPNNGTNLNGIIYESAGQTMIDRSQPATAANIDKAYTNFLTVLPKFAKFGITTVSDAGGYWPRGHQDVWTKAETEKKLTVRANNALYVYPEKDFATQVAAINALRSNDPSKLVRFNQVKIYTDGIISQTTAALLTPYETGVTTLAANDGFTYFTTAAINNYSATFDAAGFQLHFHATGDRAARMALDAIEHAQTTNNSAGLRRHRITHCYMVDASDRPRFASLGVFADFQLTPSSFTTQNISDTSFYIGSRSDYYLPSKQILDAGGNLTISSDFDADELNPFIKIQGVLTRPNQGTGGTIDMKIPTVEKAVELMTINPARLLQHDDKTGSIAVGKYADLIYLSKNIFTIPTNQISTTKCLRTLLGGKEVYKDPAY